MNGPVYDIDARTLADAFFQRWKIVVLCVIIAPIVAVKATSSYERPYKTTAKVLVEDNASHNPFLSDLLVDWSVKNRTPVITNVLRSRSVAERLIHTLEIVEEESTPLERDQAIRAVQRQINIFGLGAGIVQIDFLAEDPQASFDGMQVLMDVFLQEMLAPQREALDESVDFLATEVERVGQELEAIEAQIAAFKSEHADELPELHRLNLDTYLALTTAMLESEADLAERRQVASLSRQRLTEWDAATQELEAQVVEARVAAERARATMTQHHPRRRQAEAQLASLEGQLRDARRRHTQRSPDAVAEYAAGRLDQRDASEGVDLLTGEVLSWRSAQNDVAALEHRVELLQARMQETQGRVDAFASNELELNALLRERDIKADVYEELRLRYEDAQVTRELTLHQEASQVWVIDEPVVPPQRQKVSAVMAAAAGVIAGAMASLFGILLLELLGGAVRSPREAMACLDAPLVHRVTFLDLRA